MRLQQLAGCSTIGWARVAILIVLIVFAPGHLLEAKPAWKPIPEEELASSQPLLEPDAPAEILFWNVDVDERAFPRERKTTEYIRYKIFAPDKVDAITRIFDIDVRGSQDRTELHARLILPNGKIREFGKDAIQERPLTQRAKQAGFLGWLASGTPLVTEKFLAISGVERGAVVEFHIVRKDAWPGPVGVFVGQREDIPVRQFEYRCRLASDSHQFHNRTFVTHSKGVKLVEDTKAKTVTIAAANLPSFTPEPLSGPSADGVLTILSCYDATTMYLLPRSGKVKMPEVVPAEAGPWAPYATVVNWAARDRGLVTKKVKERAAELVQGVTDQKEKASRIHHFVSARWQQARWRVTREPPKREPNHLDEILEWEKYPDVKLVAQEFFWLALGLYRAAGFEVETVLLPNREFVTFVPDWVSPVFLPDAAVALKIGDSWVFSSPHHVNALPFGMLPWQQAGQGGLLALDRKQEFISVPVSTPQETLRGTAGFFELDENGQLKGKVIRRFTGQSAAPLRNELREASEKDRPEIARKTVGLDLKVVELTLSEITGLDGAETPLELTFQLVWPDFAVRTRDRMIFRPAVFRTDTVAPFSASTRKRGVYFPYPWQEIDLVSIKLPIGYKLEEPIAPATVESPSLTYRMRLSVEDAKHTLHARREFTSNLLVVSQSNYAMLKNTYDHISRGDQHELVLRRVTTTAVK